MKASPDRMILITAMIYSLAVLLTVIFLWPL